MSERARAQKKEGRPPANGEAGFSLLEMLIAILIFSIVTGIVYGLLEVSRADRLRTTERVEAMQSIRVALSTLGRDIHNAGFGYANTGASIFNNALAANNPLHMGPDPYAGEDRLTPIVGGESGTDPGEIPNGYFIDPKDAKLDDTDQISILYKDSSFLMPPSTAPAGPPGPYDPDPALPTYHPDKAARVASITTAGAGAGMDVYLDTTTIAAPATHCTVGELYVVTKGRDSALGVLTATDNVAHLTFQEGAGPDATLLINKNGPASPFASVGTTPPAGVISLYRVRWVTYWVSTAGTLMRTVYGHTPSTDNITHQAIAHGIKNLQFKYVMENGDILDTPGQATVGPDGVMGTNDDIEMQVRQVIVDVVFRGYAADQRLPKGVVNSNARETQFVNMNIQSTFNASNIGYDPR